MKKTIIVPALVLALSILGAFILVATAPSVESKIPDRALSAVRVREPVPQSLRLRVRSQGTVAPRTESALVPEVSGRVIQVSPNLVSGGFFEAGESLLKIEPRSFELAVARAEAALTRAKSEVDFAVDELGRQKGLAARNVASPAELSAARRAEQVAKANLTDARVALDQARWDLERSDVRAPYTGRVRNESVDVGQVVGPGGPVATLYATDYAEIRLPIPDHQLAFLDLPVQPMGEGVSGPAVELRARFAGREHRWQGNVVRTEGEIDPKSRMVHVIARVEDPYGVNPENTDRPALAVGLFVHAEIEGPMAEDVIVVPRYAMRDADHIIVVDREDKLRIREVDVLRVDGEEVLIRSQLARGERLCVSPLQVAVDGMQVLPVEDDSARAEDSRS